MMRGEFFCIDRRVWARVCDCGMNEAVAYLVLARGTGPENRSTSWSTTAVCKHGGIGIERGKQAINRLISEKLVSHGEGHTVAKPRYELILPSPQGNGAESDERIWLPNTIVTGTISGECPPLHRIRSAGDTSALRLFVDLYHTQNLRDDGGISPQVLHQEFSRKRVAEQGVYFVWGFKEGSFSLRWEGPLAPHRSRIAPKGQERHPVWASLELLQQMGLIAFVPHIFENDLPSGAEVLHPYGIGNKGEEPVESEIGAAADTAGRELASWNSDHAEREGFEWFLPVLRTLPNVQMIGVARLLYRPHTRRTSAWFAQLQEKGRSWLQKYQQIADSAANSSGRIANFG